MSEYWNITLRCDRTIARAVETYLENEGVFALWCEDGRDEIQETIVDGEWPIISVSALLPTSVDLAKVESSLVELGCELTFANVLHLSDSAEELFQSSEDRHIGRFVIGDEMPFVKPSQIALQIAPGLAFGSGEHETTALCLEFLDSKDLERKQVLDFGCGSGILAIASKKLGAGTVVAVDNDPVAREITANNAAQNNVDVIIKETLDASHRFNFVVANIFADVLAQNADLLQSVLEPQGLLALSGILAKQHEQVVQAYDQIDFKEPQQRNDWLLLVGSRR